MGEVYRARDARLGREVALKILPGDLAGDPARRQRFAQEARAVAALNHPNIMAIHDMAFEDRVAYIVSELVQGETLRRVIQRGPVPVRKALDIAVQIADGLAAAHAANIAHRDLKPDNIMVTAEGRVKILDFGLAKSIRRAPAPSDATETLTLTDPGTIVGTASYISPEQASGSEDVDGRTDQFSLGLIVHEMLSGHKAIERSTIAETLAAIIREDAAPLAEVLRGPARRVIDRCLAKEPAQRYESTRDLFLDLTQWREPVSESAPAVAVKPKRTAPVIAAAPVAGFVLAMLWLEAPAIPGRYVPIATDAGIQTMPAFSPDGGRIAYAGEVDGVFQIFIKKLGSPAATQITHQDSSCSYPLWTPDGTRIYYIVSRPGKKRSLWSIGVAGGAGELILDGVEQAALSPDGRTMAVVAAQPEGRHAVMLSSPPGAPPRPFPQASVAQLRAAWGWQFRIQFSPDGRRLGLMNGAAPRSEFWEIPLDGSEPRIHSHDHGWGGFNASFVWASDSNIIWTINSTSNSHLRNRDLQSGREIELTPGEAQERNHSISRDGRKVVFQAGEVGYDLVEVPVDGRAAIPVLATDRNEVAPAWSPDGVQFAYGSDRDGVATIWLRNRRDNSERLIANAADFAESVWLFQDCAISPDGSRVAYRRTIGATVDIWISPLAGGTPTALYQDPNRVFQRGPVWSPDGNWLAYYSLHQGKPAVMKMRVGANREPELVSYASDSNPVRWSPRGDWIAWNDGHKLVLASPDGKQKKTLSDQQWLTYGWAKDGNSLYGIRVAANRRLLLGRIDVGNGREQTAGDLGPAPAGLDFADLQGDFPYRGFSLHPDGKSFLTSVHASKGDIWMLEDFNRRAGWLDRLMRKKF